MSKSKKSKVESLFYNNKFLMIFSVVVAILLWATVKINYSADDTRTFSGIDIDDKIKISQAADYEAFFSGDKPEIKVEVSGKAYDINERALSLDDIIIEATGSYVDSAGYKVLTLTAKLKEGTTGVTIKKITPSNVTVYFDRRDTGTFNVEAKLNNELDALVSDEFTVGQPVPSMTTVEVTGPATILNKLTKVYFDAGKISEENLPLTASKEVPAVITYPLDREDDGKYLTCTSINNESNPATVTIPLYVSKEVDAAVKFVNQPAIYSEEMPQYRVNPAKVNVLYNSKDEAIDTLYVGTVDFSNVSNKVNYFEFPVDDNLSVNIVDKSIEKFTVSIDMSDRNMITFDKTPGKIVFLNQDENYTYNVNYEKSELDSISVVGPLNKLQQITEEDIQVEINVSSLNLARSNEQVVEVSNISIASEGFEDCWIYGKYKAYISVEAKN